MADVVFDKATRIYPGSDKIAVDSFDLHIEDGEFLVLVGPSGCGKSTCLRMLAGLEDVDEGSISIGGVDVTDLKPKERDIAMVFQNYALYPHMTVADNMAFALKIKGIDKEERRKMVEDAARLLDLEEFLDRKPKALSGGQRQRVAMGRAIVRQPKVFCMDEPLSNLDAKLRVQTRTQIAELQRRLHVTTVYVTHDQVEAMTMGDRVAVLKDGHLQQCDTPLRLYERPTNVFVAGFIGSPGMNLDAFPVGDGVVHLDGTQLPLSQATMEALGREGSDRVILGFRPESVEVVGDGDGFPLHVTVVEELGSDAFAYGTITPPSTDPMGAVGKQVIAKVDPRKPPAKGERIQLRIRPREELLFSTKTGERLPS